MGAADVVRRHEELRTIRRLEEADWRDIAELIRPDARHFDVRSGAAATGRRDDTRIFDSTPLYALEAFTGGLFGQATNPASRWCELTLADDPDLAKWGPVKEWLWAVTSRITASLGPAVSSFYVEATPWFADMGAFGLGVLYSEEKVGQARIVDRAISLAEIFIDTDADGEVTTVHREFALTGRQLAARFPGHEVQETRRYVVIHAVSENPDFVPGALGRRGMRWRSTYCSPDLKELYVEGGYHELPYHVVMWTRRSGRVYPVGPGHVARPDMAMLNEMERSHIVAAQFAAEPPILAHDDSVLTAADIVPNALLYGAMNEQGKALMAPLSRAQNLALSREQSEQRRNAIREAFFFGIMQLVNRPQMTATEFLGFQEEKLRLLGPNLARIQAQGLSPFIARRFRILERAGQLPPPPPELEGRRLDIAYVSPLAKMMKVAEARQALQWHGALVQAAQTNPEVLDNFDADGFALLTHEGFGVAPTALRDPRARDEIRAQRAAMQQQQAQLEAGEKQAAIAAETAHAAQAETLARGRRSAA